MQQNGKSKQEIADHLNAVDKQLAIFSALGQFQVEVFPKTTDKRTKSSKNPIRRNADPIYKLSFDLSAMYVKRLSAQATRPYRVSAGPADVGAGADRDGGDVQDRRQARALLVLLR